MKTTVYPGRILAGAALVTAGLYNTAKLKRGGLGLICFLIAARCLKKSITIDVGN